jgi:hypothetical protein
LKLLISATPSVADLRSAALNACGLRGIDVVGGKELVGRRGLTMGFIGARSLSGRRERSSWIYCIQTPGQS